MNLWGCIRTIGTIVLELVIGINCIGTIPVPCCLSCQKYLKKMVVQRVLDLILPKIEQYFMYKSVWIPQKNTLDAIIDFLDSFYSSLDSKQSTIAVYLDFSKAFVTVNHEILNRKVLHNSVRGARTGFSYLTETLPLNQNLQFHDVKHYIRCSARLSLLLNRLFFLSLPQFIWLLLCTSITVHYHICYPHVLFYVWLISIIHWIPVVSTPWNKFYTVFLTAQVRAM